MNMFAGSYALPGIFGKDGHIRLHQNRIAFFEQFPDAESGQPAISRIVPARCDPCLIFLRITGDFEQIAEFAYAPHLRFAVVVADTDLSYPDFTHYTSLQSNTVPKGKSASSQSRSYISAARAGDTTSETIGATSIRRAAIRSRMARQSS